MVNKPGDRTVLTNHMCTRLFVPTKKPTPTCVQVCLFPPRIPRLPVYTPVCSHQESHAYLCTSLFVPTRNPTPTCVHACLFTPRIPRLPVYTPVCSHQESHAYLRTRLFVPTKNPMPPPPVSGGRPRPWGHSCLGT